MSLTTLIIDSVLLLGIIGVSCYGAAILPARARLPMHFGPGGYGNWVPKNVGLLLWTVISVVIYVILAVTARGQQASGGHGLSIGLTIALAAMLVNNVVAIRIALARSGRG
jgi:hypothetical protein